MFSRSGSSADAAVGAAGDHGEPLEERAPRQRRVRVFVVQRDDLRVHVLLLSSVHHATHATGLAPHEPREHAGEHAAREQVLEIVTAGEPAGCGVERLVVALGERHRHVERDGRPQPAHAARAPRPQDQQHDDARAGPHAQDQVRREVAAPERLGRRPVQRRSRRRRARTGRSASRAKRGSTRSASTSASSDAITSDIGRRSHTSVAFDGSRWYHAEPSAVAIVAATSTRQASRSSPLPTQPRPQRRAPESRGEDREVRQHVAGARDAAERPRVGEVVVGRPLRQRARARAARATKSATATPASAHACLRTREARDAASGHCRRGLTQHRLAVDRCRPARGAPGRRARPSSGPSRPRRPAATARATRARPARPAGRRSRRSGRRACRPALAAGPSGATSCTTTRPSSSPR